MKYHLLYCVFFTTSSLLSAQNLVPNGSFEDFKSCLHNREAAMSDAAPWYISGGTPDIYQFDCGPSLVNSAYNIPYDGEVHIGLGGGPSLGGAFFAESIAVKLTEMLEAEQAYFLEASVRSFKFNSSPDDDINNCKTRPNRQFNVYLAQDSFKVEWIFGALYLEESYTNGRIVFADSSSFVIDEYSQNYPGNYTEEDRSSWYKIGQCIIAEEGERHLGLAPTVGDYEIEERCQQYIGQTFAGHYFHVDDISLKKFPEQLEATQTLCKDRGTDIHLRDLVPMPMFDASTFRWEDGRTDSVRQLSQTGTHIIEVLTDCATSLLFLTIEAEDCASKVYVPTAFSPNDDGVNDQIRPFINAPFPLENFDFQVYDRWGSLCFESQNPEKNWDGYLKQRAASEGVYIWKLQYSLKENGELKTYVETGDFLLVR